MSKIYTQTPFDAFLDRACYHPLGTSAPASPSSRASLNCDPDLWCAVPSAMADCLGTSSCVIPDDDRGCRPPLLGPSTMVTGADFSPTKPGICLLLLQCCHLITMLSVGWEAEVVLRAHIGQLRGWAP